MTLRYCTLAAVLGLGAWAPAGHAAIITFGSDLSAGADIAEARQSDTAYWQTTAGPTGTAGTAPASGQIRSFKLKGLALSQPRAGVAGGETDFHLQALRLQPAGSYLVLVTSGNFNVPQQAQGANAQTVTTYEPVNFCVTKGDVLAFNTVGGWDGVAAGGPYPDGTPLQIFARAPGALVSQFNGADQTNNGAVLQPDNVRGRDQELLMQLTLGTGSDASGLCPSDTPAGAAGPGSQVPAGGVPSPAAVAARATIPSQRVTVTRRGSLSVALFCKAGTGSTCAGKVRVLSRAGSPRVLAAKRYSIGAGRTRRATMRLSAAARRLFARRGQRLPVTIQAVTEPGGAARTVTRSLTLRRRGA